MKKHFFSWLGFIVGIFLVVFSVYHRTIILEPVKPAVVEIPAIPIPYIPEDVAPPDTRSQILRNYFGKYRSPLAKHAEVFIKFADENELDWRLLPAISIRESSGGKNMYRPNNPFGWNENKGMSFDSLPAAIEYVSSRLAQSPYYSGKTDYQKLRIYNSIIPAYPDEVINIMQQIQKDED